MSMIFQDKMNLCTRTRQIKSYVHKPYLQEIFNNCPSQTEIPQIEMFTKTIFSMSKFNVFGYFF